MGFHRPKWVDNSRLVFLMLLLTLSVPSSLPLAFSALPYRASPWSTTITSAGLSCALQCVPWIQLESAVSGTGQPWPLLTETLQPLSYTQYWLMYSLSLSFSIRCNAAFPQVLWQPRELAGLTGEQREHWAPQSSPHLLFLQVSTLLPFTMVTDFNDSWTLTFLTSFQYTEAMPLYSFWEACPCFYLLCTFWVFFLFRIFLFIHVFTYFKVLLKAEASYSARPHWSSIIIPQAMSEPSLN